MTQKEYTDIKHFISGSDHVLVSTAFHVNSNDTLEKHIAPDVIGQGIAEWNKTHDGVFVCELFLRFHTS